MLTMLLLRKNDETIKHIVRDNATSDHAFTASSKVDPAVGALLFCPDQPTGFVRMTKRYLTSPFSASEKGVNLTVVHLDKENSTRPSLWPLGC